MKRLSDKSMVQFQRLRSVMRGVVLVFAVVMSTVAQADDTEIYNTAYAEAGQPNILFMLDSSGSMKLSPDGKTLAGGEQNPNSRYQIMKRVLQEVLASVPNTINVGLINYGGHTEKAAANGVKYPVTSLTPKDKNGDPSNINVRADILKAIDQFEVKGYTPIVQSIYESALYYRGDAVDYGASGKKQKLANPASYTAKTAVGVSKVADPVIKTCDKTAGKCPDKVLSCRVEYYCDINRGYCPAGVKKDNRCKTIPAVPATAYTVDTVTCPGGYDEAGNCPDPVVVQKEELAPAYPEYLGCPVESCDYEVPGDSEYVVEGTYKTPILKECQSSYLVIMSDGEPDDGLTTESGQDVHDPVIVNKVAKKFNITHCENLGDGRCGPELTKYLANVDQSPGLEGDQVVGTYAIGFALEGKGQQYLQKLANLGKKADPEGTRGFYSAANEAELKNVFNSIVTSIAVVNHDLAIPTISVDPETGLTHGDEVYFPFFRPGISPRWPGNLKKYQLDHQGGTPQVVDSRGEPIYDKDGNPVQGSRSFWLPDSDAPDGGDITAGGVARLLEGGRTLFTDDGDKLIPLTADNVEPDWFAAGGDVDIKALLDYAYGIDPAAGAGGKQFLHQMGDILHSAPQLVTYKKGDSVIFVGTNEGYLHAFDTKTGKELFAFIPRTLLPNLTIRKENKFGVPHPYGLDGPITVWKDDNPNDQDATNKTFLVIGMRRGGVNYYALDVTDPTKPVLAWEIKGGEKGTTGFEDLGQTWARAIPARVHLDPATISPGKKQPLAAFIISGGYDPDFDQPDPAGRFAAKIKGGRGDTIFIVDARSGKKLWQADFGNKASSIPANARVIDIDNNGVEDRLYVTDVEGHLFRVDLPDPGNKLIHEAFAKPRISEIADLSSNGTGIHRRFYYEPDSVLVVDQGVVSINLAIGSGYRAHPLKKGDEVDQDYLFVVKDASVYRLPPAADSRDYVLIKPADLAELPRTDKNSAGEVINAVSSRQPLYGWRLPLNKKGGEKALAKSVTLKNTVYFTTFEPETKAAADVCSNATHTGRIYGLDIRSGKPALKFENIKDPTQPIVKQSVEFSTPDIPSEVVLVASRYELNPGGRNVRGVKFNLLSEALKGLIAPTFSGLNKWYWEVEK